jgi:glycosyltransferase involved in cell wall biosynthesis
MTLRGVADAVRGGFNGLFVRPLSIEAISEAILKLYHDKQLRPTLGAKGRRLAEVERTWAKGSQRIIDSSE